MRLPPHPDQLVALLGSVDKLDCQIELTLMRIGIIARCDLKRIREMLRHADVGIDALTEPGGRRFLRFHCRGTLLGILDDSGALRHYTTIADALIDNSTHSTIDAAS